MKKIKSFDNFITEKLGILTDLEKMADIILVELSKKNYFRYKNNYLDKDITIHCFKTKFKKGISGSFTVDDYENYEFTIKIDELSKSTLIHELKHLDRFMRRGVEDETYYYIKHIGRYVAKQYKHLFIDENSAEVLIETFYFCNPDEFEAYYNDIYYELKEMINDTMSRDEKIRTIKEHLENQEIFIFYKKYYETKFKLENFFKSKEDCNFFLKEFFLRQELLYYDLDNSISILDKIKSWFKSNLLNKFMKDEKLDTDFKQFNYYINKVVQNNFKKFSRLYALLT